MMRYRYFLTVFLLMVSFSLAQRQPENLNAFTHVCLFATVHIDSEHEQGYEEAVLEHMYAVAEKLDLHIRDIDECEALTGDGNADTLKLLLTLQAHKLPEGGYVYAYTLSGLLDSLGRFSRVTIYQLTNFGVTAETERDVVMRSLVCDALSGFATDWQSNSGIASNPVGVTSERREGPTPNGGTYSIAYYRDENGNPTTKGQARIVEIIEYDAKGEAIHSTIGYINP